MPARVIILAEYRPKPHNLAADLWRAWADYNSAVWGAWARFMMPPR